MEEFERDIRLHWDIHYTGRRCEWKQRGGGHSVMSIDGHDIHYRDHIDGNIIVVHGGDDYNYSPCFVLNIDPKTNGAVLQTLYKRDNCFDDGHQNSRAVLKAVYRLAQEYGTKYMEFRDVSVKYCDKREIRLSDLSFLTTGKTWYESVLPELQCTDCEDLEEWRKQAHAATWRTVGADLVDIDIPGVDFDASGSSMIVLNAMKKDGRFCSFFVKYMERLLYRSGFLSLYGHTWYCPIPTVGGRRRQTKRQRKYQRERLSSDSRRTERAVGATERRVRTRRVDL